MSGEISSPWTQLAQSIENSSYSAFQYTTRIHTTVLEGQFRGLGPAPFNTLFVTHEKQKKREQEPKFDWSDLADDGHGYLTGAGGAMDDLSPHYLQEI